MHDAGMSAIMVKFQDHHTELKLEKDTLYNLVIQEESGEKIEMLYFTAKPETGQGEVLLFKWDANANSLKPIRTVMDGMDMDQSLYRIKEGYKWQVEGVYRIRKKVPRGNVIEEIRKDIKFLEGMKSRRTITQNAK